MRSLIAVLIVLAVAGPPGAAAPGGLDLVAIPAGAVVMGDAAGEPDETPREVAVAAFRIMRHEVGNAQFAAFVAATGYVTAPERAGKGWVWEPRWRLVAGAD